MVWPRTIRRRLTAGPLSVRYECWTTREAFQLVHTPHSLPHFLWEKPEWSQCPSIHSNEACLLITGQGGGQARVMTLYSLLPVNHADKIHSTVPLMDSQRNRETSLAPQDAALICLLSTAIDQRLTPSFGRTTVRLFFFSFFFIHIQPDWTRRWCLWGCNLYNIWEFTTC